LRLPEPPSRSLSCGLNNWPQLPTAIAEMKEQKLVWRELD
jgi:hypothetical protein